MNKYARSAFNTDFKKFVDDYCITEDFPCPGVRFLDIFPLLESNNFVDVSIMGLVEAPLIFVPEARGFLFYQCLNPNRVVPLRKSNKLPGALEEIVYHKEYGDDKLYFQKDAVLRKLKSLQWNKEEPVPVAFFDDIIATGGTAIAFIEKLNSLNLEGYSFKVESVQFYIDLQSLNGIEKLKSLYPSINVESFYTY